MTTCRSCSSHCSESLAAAQSSVQDAFTSSVAQNDVNHGLGWISTYVGRPLDFGGNKD